MVFKNLVSTIFCYSLKGIRKTVEIASPYPRKGIMTRARTHTRKFKMAVEATVDLNVPRYSSELRSMRCEQSLLNKTDGSASFLQGNVWIC